MKMRISDIRRAVSDVILEINNTMVVDESYRRLKVVDTTPYDPGDRDKRQGSIEKGMASIAGDLEDEIEELMSMPEFKDIDAFIATKLDDDDFTYDFVELQALARNMTIARTKNRNVTVASQVDVSSVRQTLEKEIGFKYIPREPVKNIRGASSSAHGTHPFAGSGGGGSGFSSDREGGGGFTSFGGGPGAIGGGYKWKPNDKKNLPMGSKRSK